MWGLSFIFGWLFQLTNDDDPASGLPHPLKASVAFSIHPLCMAWLIGSLVLKISEGWVHKPQEVVYILKIHPCLLEAEIGPLWRGLQSLMSLLQSALQLPSTCLSQSYKKWLALWITIHLSLFLHLGGEVLGLPCQLHLLLVEGQVGSRAMRQVVSVFLPVLSQGVFPLGMGFLVVASLPSVLSWGGALPWQW